MDATPVSPIDHNHACPDSSDVCLPSAMPPTDPTSSQALAQRNLAGVLLGILLLILGFLLWVFFGRWGKRSRAFCRGLFCCQRGRRKRCAGLPLITCDPDPSTPPSKESLPCDDAEKGPSIEVYKQVYISKDSFPMHNPFPFSAIPAATTRPGSTPTFR